MEKLPKSQVAKGVFLLILLLFIPFISSSLRPSYLYFLLNIIIVALGIEAGFFKAISRPRDDKKALNAAAATPIAIEANVTKVVVNPHEWIRHAAKPAQKMQVVKKKVTENTTPRVQTSKLRRPSLKEVKEEEGEWEEITTDTGELSKQELFARAEAFIGNFYMQLGMSHGID